jgi:hypothetical protein
VARRSAGGIGRARLGWTSFEPFTTGLAFGDGGMERPRRGVRLPPWARPPGTGGRRRGTAEDMFGCGLEVGALAVGSIYCGLSHELSWGTFKMQVSLWVRRVACIGILGRTGGAANDSSPT